MSLKPKEKRSHTTETINKRVDKKIDLSVLDKISLKLNSNSVINVSNSNNANSSLIYNLDSVFKKRIDKLNIKFYFESEKYLSNRNETEKCQDQLYVILFKQISLYIEEVERLNNLLKDKIEEEKILKEKLEELNKNEKDKNYSTNMIKSLKNENAEIQKKLEEKNKIEDKLKKENEIIRRNLKICEEKIQRYDIASKNGLNESSNGLVINRKKMQIADSFRKHPNSAASTKSSTHENCVNKLRVDDFLTNNSSIKNYLEEDSYALNNNITQNNLRNSLISNEDDTINRQKIHGVNLDFVNFEGINSQKNFLTNINNPNNIFQGDNQNGLNGNNTAVINFNVNNNTNFIDKKSIIGVNMKSPKGNSNNITGNKNIFSFRKNNSGNHPNANTNNPIMNINYNSNNINYNENKHSKNTTDNAISVLNNTNFIQSSSNSHNYHSNLQTKDLKIIKSIKQRNKASKNDINNINIYNIISTHQLDSQDSLISNKIFPNQIRIEGESISENNQKSQSLQININTNATNSITTKNPSIIYNSTYNNQIYHNYIDNINSELIYLNQIEKDLVNLIESEKLKNGHEYDNDNSNFVTYNDNQINICENYDRNESHEKNINFSKSKEIILSDEEFDEGYKSGPCFYDQNKNYGIENDYFRSSSNEKSNNIKKSFLNNGIYPITTTIYLDLEKKNKMNLKSNDRNFSNQNNRNYLVGSSSPKNKLNINYLRKVKTIK